MLKEKLKEKLYIIITEYLNKKCDEKEIMARLSWEFPISEVIDIDDELLKGCYLALFHLNEGYVHFAEIVYYYECLKGRRVFSLKQISNYIKENINLCKESYLV